MGPAWIRRWGDRLRSFEGRTPPVYESLEAATERMREANPRLPDDFVPHLAKYATRPVDGGYTWKYDPWVNGRLSMEVRRSELPAFWEAITCPVLLVTGEESRARARQHPDAEQALPAGADGDRSGRRALDAPRPAGGVAGRAGRSTQQRRGEPDWRARA
ncbi:MAG: hypothetical protein U5Q44_01190 [Dehalococcoidia bacterium]|nr:hypothetical protein [Dehalococcoidia bacterium]